VTADGAKTVKMRLARETKNCFVFEGDDEHVDGLYVAKTLWAEAPAAITVTVEAVPA
jgi:hypothetical protein